jgi:hypothetical protein
MFELIKKELGDLIGKNIIVFFRYATLSYNIKKSGKLIAMDEKHFVIDEIKDGRTTYSFDFVIQVMEDKTGDGRF